MIFAWHFAVVAAICMLMVWPLARARWPWRAPSTGVVLWQALGLAWGLSVIGTALAIGLEPYRLGVLPGLARLGGDLTAGELPAQVGVARLAAVAAGLGLAARLLGTLAACAMEVAIARKRHRTLLALVAHDDPEAPGALVLDHPAAAAYCVPGIRGQIVVSAGALRLLDRSQLAAVLSHERAHAREHHDLVVLPFAALRRALPRVGLVGDAVAAVSLLVEMCADDRVLRQHAARPLIAALLRFGSEGPPTLPRGALGAAEEVVSRVLRLAGPRRRLPGPARVLVIAAAALLVATPASLFALPT
jgi:Zn-dependent protease with chaperone function